jgi:hypothetical protein
MVGATVGGELVGTATIAIGVVGAAAGDGVGVVAAAQAAAKIAARMDTSI